jgi:hypothetical protein
LAFLEKLELTPARAICATDFVIEESVLHVTALFVDGSPLKVNITLSGSLLGISQ